MSDKNAESELSRRSVLKVSAKGGLGAGALVASGVGTAAASCPRGGCRTVVDGSPLYAVTESWCELRYADYYLDAGAEVTIYDCCVSDGGSSVKAYYVQAVNGYEEGWIDASQVGPC